MSEVRVKICGITNMEDAKIAVKLGADALGFVFASSPRRVSENQADEIIRELPPFTVSVGIFVNEQLAQVKEIIKICNLNAVQFHGDESPDYCGQFEEVTVIKTLRVREHAQLKSLSDYAVDGFLLDTYVEGKAGGTGISFDWNLARPVKDFVLSRSGKDIFNGANPSKDCRKPLILSGGLSPDNVAEAIKMVEPYAVDVSSGVESAAGKKDFQLMKEFIRRAKHASR